MTGFYALRTGVSETLAPRTVSERSRRCSARVRGEPAPFPAAAVRKVEDQELQMGPTPKRMMFEMNAFTREIIRGDSSLSAVEQFWKLDYNI